VIAEAYDGLLEVRPRGELLPPPIAEEVPA
jgi:hypothetical protein